MIEYKEIQAQTYLNLDNGKVYFAVEEVLRIINTRTERNFSNSISPSRLNKLLKKANIKWHHINRSQIGLIIDELSSLPNDKYNSSLDKIKVLRSTQVAKLVQMIRSMPATKNANYKKIYKELTSGSIESTNNDGPYFTITEATYEIQGHLANSHVSAPATNISPQTLLKKAREFEKTDPDKYQVIKVLPNEIDFYGSRIHANSTELYINLKLYEKLLNHYKLSKGTSVKKETQSLHNTIDSYEPVAKFIRKNYKDQLKNAENSTGTVSLLIGDIRAIDKSIKRQYKKVEDFANQQFINYEKKIQDLQNTNLDYWQMVGELRRFLNGEYYNKVIGKAFSDPFFKESLTLQIKDIINRY